MAEKHGGGSRKTDMRTGIIFDVDGTLWDSSYEVAEAWNEVFARHDDIGRGCTRDDIMRVMGKTMTDIARLFFPTLPEEKQIAYLRECETYELTYLRGHFPKPFDGVSEMLHELAKDYPLCIVSNCQVGYIDLFIEAAGAADVIDDFLCFGDNEKPKGDNIRLIAERNRLDKYYYVGDIQSDYDATVAGGGSFIHAAYGFGTIRETVPSIREIGELAALMRELEK